MKKLRVRVTAKLIEESASLGYMEHERCTTCPVAIALSEAIEESIVSNGSSFRPVEDSEDLVWQPLPPEVTQWIRSADALLHNHRHESLPISFTVQVPEGKWPTYKGLDEGVAGV